ncbi:hypothetical protein [Spirosoma spitsbergense]|jgi:hypothetical protein|uniref:hypothetical protein n=1 Tax=Spirosoma spitsbergense TaxID=431554 RepID=UPI000381439E|nr:hypothetical protein [Spirosoma spitsbergense]
MTPFANFLTRIANWKTLLFLGVIYVSFPAYWFKNAGATISQLAGKPVDPIDLTFGFNPARTLAMVAGYGPTARAFYARTELTIDLVYPVVYSFLLAVILTMLFRHWSNRQFVLLPFVVLLSDYLENAAIVTLLTGYPAQSMTVAVLCEVFKLIKWLSFGITVCLVVYGLVLRVSGRRDARPRNG